MEKYKITIDSACDLPFDLMEKENISFIPFSVLIDGEDKLDGVSVLGKDIVKYVEDTDILPKTSAPSVSQYEDFFEKALAESEKIIHFSISNDFSVAHNNAIKASEKFEDGKIYIVDTRSLSSGIGLVALSGLDLFKQGKDIAEVAEQCREIATRTQASFTLDDLRMLYKGGRCGGLAFFMGKALNIKPSLLVKGGKLGVNKKYMLTKYEVAVRKYVLDTLKQFPNMVKTRCFVTHTPTDPKVVEMVKNMAKEHFDEVIESDAGATICSHCGKNTIGILYVCEESI